MSSLKTITKPRSPEKFDRWQIGAEAIAHNRFWFFLLTALGSTSNVVYTCTVPLVGFGVIAGSTLSRKKAVTMVMTMWLVNQIFGFTIHQYPLTFKTFVWGGVIGLGALLATLFASLKSRFVASELKNHCLWLGIALIGGYVVYELTILLATLFLGGLESFTLPILWSIFVGNAVWGIPLALGHGFLMWQLIKKSSVKSIS
ncbi:MAG: hypothetical protein ABI417_01820 [Coleofasciculaceae cyanobacterium]